MSSLLAYTARARSDLSARAFFADLPPDEQDRAAAELARRLALVESPIGRAAAKVSGAVGHLADAFDEFLDQFPDAATARAAGHAALAAAGLSEDPGRAYRGDHYADTPEMFRHLLYSLELMFPPLEHCDPPRLPADPNDTVAEMPAPVLDRPEGS